MMVCVSDAMIKHLQKKSMCVSHAIQVSGMNAHFPIFKSDTIYTVTILMRGIRGRMGVEGRKSLVSLNTGCLSDAQPIDSPTLRMERVFDWGIGISKLLLHIEYFKTYPDTGRSFGYTMILQCLVFSNLSEDDYDRSFLARGSLQPYILPRIS